MTVYNMSYLLDKWKLRAEKTQKLRPLVSSPVQQLCLSHIWRLASFTTFAYFSGHAFGFAFVQNDYKQLEAIFLFHWFDTHLLVLSQQISSLNSVQWLPRKCNTNTSKCDKMWVTFWLQLSIYTVLMMYTFHRSKMMYTKCIQNISHILTNFCINVCGNFCMQNLVAINLTILHTKCIQKFVEMWDKLHIHLVYILYTSVAYFL